MAQELHLNCQDKPITKIVHAVQNDTGRVLKIYIEDRSITHAMTFVFIAEKPSGLKIYNSAAYVSGYVEVELTNQTLAEVGNVKAQLQITDTNGLMTSYMFYIAVDEVYRDDSSIESSNEFTALQSMSNDFANIKGQFEQAIAAVTVDSEVITARTGADGTQYPTLASRLNAENTQLNRDLTEMDSRLSESIAEISDRVDVVLKHTSNRFDITKITRNQFVNVDGSVTTSANFSTTDFIPVKVGETLYFNAIRNVDNGFQRFDERFLCAYDYDKNPLPSKGGTFVGGLYSVTEDVAYIVVSISNTYIDTYTKMYIGIYDTDGLNRGAYEEYGLKFNKSVIKNSYIVVDGKGNGDYRTINEALENANDSKDNHVTIIVMPYVYEESLILVGRYITLIGVDRDSCIVRNTWNDYLRPPLDLWSNSAVINMSFIAEATEETASGGASGKAYGIHIDQNSKYKQMKDRGQDTTDYEGVARVENCYIASRYVNGIGAGTCPNSTMIIKNCEIETLEKDNNGFMGGLRIHNYPFTGENQKAIVDSCIIHNPWLTPPVVLQDTNHTSGGTGDNVDTVFTFRNNIVYNEQGVNCNISVAEPHDSSCISGYIKKGISNFGNSNAKLN